MKNEKKVIGGEYAIPLELIMEVEKECTIDRKSNRYYCSSGRTALYIILENMLRSSENTQSVLIPDYICPSIIKAVNDSGSQYYFYHIGEDFLPNLENINMYLSSMDAILLVNYFGILNLESIITAIRQKSQSIKIIVDDVQNYYGFGKEVDFDFSFTSYRKWFPVSDGAEICVKDRIWSFDSFDFEYENSFAQYKYAGNILKNFKWIIDDSIFLRLIQEGENILDEKYKCGCTKLSLSLMEHLDTLGFAEIRKNNAKILHEGLIKIGIPHLYKENTVPLFIPIILKEGRERIRRTFFEQNIFCPIHWMQDGMISNDTNSLYAQELSLICDQRYGVEDMNKILEILKNEF